MMVDKVMRQILVCAVIAPALATATPVVTRHAEHAMQCRGAAAPMAQIPAGLYQPFFKVGTGDGTTEIAPPVLVPAFEVGCAPVTREEFRAFVLKYPEWRKSRVKALFAEATYLADWPDELDPGSDRLREPVTRVSWFAARAYCEAHNARLPTVVEWERVAGGSPSEDGADQAIPDPYRPFRFAMGRAAPELHSTGVVFPGVWEWNADFNSALASLGGGSGSKGSSSLFCGDGYRASNAKDYGAFLRHSFRSSLRANYALKNLGFRCVKGK